ncbi:MAG TPA: DUF2142 domain-containing protein, partial [Thermoanaerobaculia bacterium]|nr:DUF2142 domain-containing protein [Thermoanaerobaculia bacterium]
HAVLTLIIGGVTCAGAAISAWNGRRVYESLRPGVDAPAQIAFTLEAPATTASLLVRETVVQSPRIAAQFVGKLGWLDTPMPAWLVVLDCFFLLLLSLADGPVRWMLWSERTALAVVSAATIFAIALSQYVIWTPLRADFVAGMQGRYFLPVAPFALAVLNLRRQAPSWLRLWIPLMTSLVSTIGIVTAMIVLARRYYGA